MHLDQIFQAVRSYPAQCVCVTGGEPLAQPQVHALLARLCNDGYGVSLETSGALDIRHVDPRVSRVLDLKTPGSLEAERNLYSNLKYLTRHDQIKFVICDRQDFEWAVQCVKARQLADMCTVWFSPSADQLEPAILADWILDEGVQVRFQLQLHKVLWGNTPGK